MLCRWKPKALTSARVSGETNGMRQLPACCLFWGAHASPRAIFRRLVGKALFGGDAEHHMRDAYAPQNLAAIAKDTN